MFGNDKNAQLKKIGKVIENEGKVLVYVRQRTIYKYNRKVLPCEGVKEKKIYYIFDNIYFGDKTCISANNANLIFRDSSFTESLKVERANSIEMENNKFTFYSLSKNFIDLTANKIVIKNNNFANNSFAKDFEEPFVNISLIGEETKIDNSIICTEYGGRINIMANNLILNNSAIKGPDIYLNADDITTSRSIIVAPEKIIIDNVNCNFMCAIKSPITIYNDIKLNSSDSQIIEIDEEKAKLLEYRFQLINTLHQVEMNCLKENSVVLAELQQRLKNRKITKVLKK